MTDETIACPECGQVVPPTKRGRPRIFCCRKCWQKDYNRLRMVPDSECKYRRRGKMPKAYTLNTPQGRSVALIARAKHRASRKGIEFALKAEDIVDALEVGHCQVTGAEFIFNWQSEGASNHGPQPFSPTLDRIDNSKGYEPGNVQVVCWAFNAMKGPSLSTEEALSLMIQAAAFNKVAP